MQNSADVSPVTQTQIDFLDEKIELANKHYQMLYEGSANIDNQISNQIAAATLGVEILGVVFAIAGIGLGIYINSTYQKIVKLKNTAEEIKSYIDGHNQALYKKLRRDDTVSILERLSRVPEDILNLSTLLFSRELESEDFPTLKHAYLKAKEAGAFNTSSNYLQMFMQHFPYETLKDNDLKSDYLASLDRSKFNSMFNNDIECFFKRTLLYVHEKGISNHESKEIIMKIMLALHASKHKEKYPSRIKEWVTESGLDVPLFIQTATNATENDVYKNWLLEI